MDKNYIIDELIKEISKEFDIDNNTVCGESKLIDDVGMSSLDIMVFLSFIEEKFNISIDIENLRKIITIFDLSNYIYEKINEVSN